jgi:hypothetical protein
MEEDGHPPVFFLAYLYASFDEFSLNRNQSGFSPRMMRIRIMTTAITRRMLIKPPIVYEVTRPKNQRIKSRTAIVTSIDILNGYLINNVVLDIRTRKLLTLMNDVQYGFMSVKPS